MTEAAEPTLPPHALGAAWRDVEAHLEGKHVAVLIPTARGSLDQFPNPAVSASLA